MTNLKRAVKPPVMIRVTRVATFYPPNEPATYAEAIEAGQAAAEELGDEFFETYIDVCDEYGEVLNEAAYNEEKS